MVERFGDWFISYTGKQIYPLDFRPEDINIHDIAHSLALTCRWAGHCTEMYSVADHSIMCAEMANVTAGFPRTSVQWCLLHDAGEAYLHDAITPIKKDLYFKRGDEFVSFKDIENRILKCIGDKFGLPWPIPKEVHTMDARMLKTEALDITRFKDSAALLPKKAWWDNEALEGLDLIKRPWFETEQGFIHTFKKLFPAYAREADDFSWMPENASV
jgi:5'-deoxynucleotidase YfbR-like HD superfamily hydrolase